MAQITRIDPKAQQKKEKLRVAAYCRVSSNSADQLNSYTRQLSAYKAMVEKRPDWELVDIFADEGISGTSTDKRTEFLRMIKLCELKQIDLVITKSVSRFARNVKEALEYVRKLKLLGVGVMFEKEGINTCSLADEMLLNTFAAIAQEESVSISQNIKMANRKRMAAGEYKNASTAYGFERVDGKLVPYEPEAAVVKRIYESFLNGLSTVKIADMLKNERIPTKQGKFGWRDYHIAEIIRNEKNVGDSMFQKKMTVGFPFKLIKNRGEEDKYYTMNTHEGIVNRETYEAANELLQKKREKFSAKTDKKEYVFSKVFHCSACGSVIIRKRSKGCERWCCKAHANDSKRCNAHYIQTDRIEDGFITIINNLRFGSETIEYIENEYVRAIHQFRMNDEASQSINKEIAELNGQILMLEQLHSKGYLAVDAYQSSYRDISKKISELKSQKTLTSVMVLEDNLKKVRELKSKLEEITDPMSSFDAGLFKSIVISGMISEEDEMTLELLGGLKITEKI